MSYREDSVWFDHSRSLSRAASSTGGSTGGSNRATLDRSGSTALVPTTDDDENDSDSDDGSDHIIMAVDQRGSKMGCAYYTAADETLSFMEDVELPSADCFDALKFQVNPTVLLLSSRMDDIERAPLATGEDGDEEEPEKPYRVLVRAAGEFAYDGGRRKLVALHIGQEYGPEIIVPTDHHDVSAQGQSKGKLLKLASWIDLNSKISVGCAGAVLSYLKRRKANEEGSDGGDGLHIRSIELFSLADVMFVNADTICSLQIFENESHPNFHMQGKGGRGKEGLSLFGIINSTRSPMGQRLLKQWFLRPSLSIDVIRERQAGVAILLRDDNSDVLKTLEKSLKMVKNIPKILGQLKRGKGSGQRGGEYASLLTFTTEALNIRSIIQDVVGEQRTPIFNKIMNTFDVNSLHAVRQLIYDTVDFEESAAFNCVAVKRHVDDTLDNLKHRWAGMPDFLRVVAVDVATNMGLPRDIWSDVNVGWYPTYGYLLSVPFGFAEMLSEEGYRYEFGSDGAAYFKSPEMDGLDNDYGDVEGMIGDREIELIYDLQMLVLEREDVLIECVRVCAELDCLMSLAESAAKYKYICPTITEENIVEIKQGRHPLQELCVASYVPNDCYLVGGRDTAETHTETSGESDEPSMILLTGPNFSGKSVYLKQIALITYMAHIGSFVPAESAIIGITDKILTRIQTRESVSRLQSAFMIDLQQIALSFRLATSRSLLIIDEFGKGTTASDGAGLACAVFEHLLNLPSAQRPKVAASTHYHELFESSFLLSHAHLWCGQMSVAIDSDAEEVEDQVTYLYVLKPGRTLDSLGTVCATLNGIDKETVDRAIDIIQLAARGEDLVSACVQLSEGEVGELEVAEAAARRFVEEFDVEEEEGDGGGDGGGASGGESVRAKLERVLQGVMADD